MDGISVALERERIVIYVGRRIWSKSMRIHLFGISTFVISTFIWHTLEKYAHTFGIHAYMAYIWHIFGIHLAYIWHTLNVPENYAHTFGIHLAYIQYFEEIV